MRRFVQIAPDGPVLYAVADDGTAWRWDARQDRWTPIPPLPPAVRVPHPTEQGYLHVDGPDFEQVTASLALIEQLCEDADSDAERQQRLGLIHHEAGAVRARLLAIRKGAKTT